MSNLENITKKILDDAKVEAERINLGAKEKVKEIIQPKLEEAKREAARILKKAEENSTVEKDKIIDARRLKNRDAILAIKQDMIENIFHLAEEKLATIKDEDYFKIIKKTLAGFKGLDGLKLILQDGRRAPDDLGIEISEETTSNGFKILDGATLLNFNFSDLMESKRLELTGDIAERLFKRG